MDHWPHGAFQIPPYAIKKSATLQHVLAKLARAEEHIDLLETEVNAYLAKRTNQVLLNHDSESEAAFTTANETGVLDPRLGIITGEVLHQLRSSLDHTVCALIRKCGNQPTTKSQFPLFYTEPTKKKDIDTYNSQVEGITNAEALDLIQAFQPYRQDTHELIRYSAYALRVFCER
jgi:hypothetical protein